MTVTLLWFRHNLRLADNAALITALRFGQPVVPFYIADPAMALGGASRWWLHHSLTALDADLRQRGSQLVIHQGDTRQILQQLVQHADRLVYPLETDPTGVQLQTGLDTLPCQVVPTLPNLLVDLDAHKNLQGKPFQVFTAFWRAWLKTGQIPTPQLAPDMLPAVPESFKSLPLASLGLLPPIPWDAGFYDHWQPGEAGAHKALRHFTTHALGQYQTDRNRPDRSGTSHLSPHLHFGEISVAQVWQLVVNTPGMPQADVDTYLAELGWREFAHYLLYHFPHTQNHPLRQEFAGFNWRQDEGDTLLKAWQQGQTGYPIVDAGMRQLWHTGWMHNRVRMIVASFLVKHLRLPWQLGAAWFWDTLVDADAPANTLGWQWSAGCGADAAPYFRIFNPVLQGEKFDPQGQYVRRWVPELKDLPNKTLHKPWESGLKALTSYPSPLVDHSTARADALAAFQALRQ
jgi:deoxyribodipyrimidine photo-lyase